MNGQAQAFVSTKWLNSMLSQANQNLIVLDATLAPVGVAPETYDQRPALPGALLFEIDGQFSDNTNPLPHTLLSENDFEQQARKLGINNDSIIVVYDAIGVYSAPRAWWNFKIYGHEQVFILNGGLPAWQKAGLRTLHSHQMPQVSGNFKAQLKTQRLADSDKVLAASQTSDIDILDARALGRFLGEQKEPRKGMRSGHIPSSKNLPFKKLLSGDYIADLPILETELNSLALVKDKLILCSCGSGITACILLSALWQAGFNHIGLYDGSWSEWGSNAKLPLETC